MRKCGERLTLEIPANTVKISLPAWLGASRSYCTNFEPIDFVDPIWPTSDALIYPPWMLIGSSRGVGLNLAS
jgi:hypothetical protein